MSALFNPTRANVRQFFVDAWSRERAGSILEPIEVIAVDWIRQHPEYHAALAADASEREQNYAPEDGRTNPFLHLSMHLSIAEQVSIDQPPGIRAATQGLAARLGSMHEAHHAVMECLGGMLWESQRSATPPDAEAYLECVRRARG